MLYQKILIGETPYHVGVGAMGTFEEHRHADIEFNYCISGELEIIIDKKHYCLHAGELALINPMVSHSVPKAQDQACKCLSVTLGASFLRRHFASFSQNRFRSAVCRLSNESEDHARLRALLEEAARWKGEEGEYAELMLAGVLYQICANLTLELCREETHGGEDLRMVANVEKALELIYYRYAEPLTVEDAAAVTGYGKSNFCKIFKRIAGDSFHQVLNRQRVEIACGFLSETATSVANIAQEVGFSDSKTFCRIFKRFQGVTPGEYRAQQQQKR